MANNQSSGPGSGHRSSPASSMLVDAHSCPCRRSLLLGPSPALCLHLNIHHHASMSASSREDARSRKISGVILLDSCAWGGSWYLHVCLFPGMNGWLHRGWAEKWLRETESQPARHCTLPYAASKLTIFSTSNPRTSLKMRAQAESLLKFIAEGKEQFITDV